MGEMRKGLSNSEVVRHILWDSNAESSTGNLWGYGEAWRARQKRLNVGYIPEKVAKSLQAVADNLGGVSGIIYSYGTPIAVRIDNMWLVPDVKYSATTSSKHQSQLYILNPRYLPWDASEDDVYDILNGYVKYDRTTQKMERGWNTRHES